MLEPRHAGRVREGRRGVSGEGRPPRGSGSRRGRIDLIEDEAGTESGLRDQASPHYHRGQSEEAPSPRRCRADGRTSNPGPH